MSHLIPPATSPVHWLAAPGNFLKPFPGYHRSRSSMACATLNRVLNYASWRLLRGRVLIEKDRDVLPEHLAAFVCTAEQQACRCDGEYPRARHGNREGRDGTADYRCASTAVPAATTANASATDNGLGRNIDDNRLALLERFAGDWFTPFANAARSLYSWNGLSPGPDLPVPLPEKIPPGKSDPDGTISSQAC